MERDKFFEINKLVRKLNNARKAYEQEDIEVMSNLEYDKLYDELLKLEQETGIIMSNSPTVNVGYEIQSSLPKEAHGTPMLSLDKTKDGENLKAWLGSEEGLLSWKLDGITMVLTYEKGILTKAITRGSGHIGEVVTSNAKVFENLPIEIAYTGKVVVRGEAVIPYSIFEKINEEIEDVAQKYKNPRNLCSGTVRQLNNEVTAKRKVHFYAFALVEKQVESQIKKKSLEIENDNSQVKTRKGEIEFLSSVGFETVDFVKVNNENLDKELARFKSMVVKNHLPSDGLVLVFNNIEYGKSLGATSKFPRDSIAFKWEDEIAETVLKEIEWSASRTGLINPVAIFEPVELEGTTVSRAGLHNLSILEELRLDVGDRIGVYKANMIIPQISENFSKNDEGNLPWASKLIPKNCPVCESETVVKLDEESLVKTLCCINAQCSAKKIKALTHFVSRDAMNIEGLSEATIEKLMEVGAIKEFSDIFRVSKYKEVITQMDGLGEKSFNNLVEAVNKAKNANVVRLLFSLGISNIGLANAKNICKACDYNWDEITDLTYEELMDINGIGEIMAKGFTDYFSDEVKKDIVENIVKEITFESMENGRGEQVFEGKTFVITGAVKIFNSRKVLQEFIEGKGGKVTGSVTTKTDYLINNDNLSGSSKNKKAKELNVEIITEEEFKKLQGDYVPLEKRK